MIPCYDFYIRWRASLAIFVVTFESSHTESWKSQVPLFVCLAVSLSPCPSIVFAWSMENKIREACSIDTITVQNSLGVLLNWISDGIISRASSVCRGGFCELRDCYRLWCEMWNNCVFCFVSGNDTFEEGTRQWNQIPFRFNTADQNYYNVEDDDNDEWEMNVEMHPEEDEELLRYAEKG